MPTKEQFMRYRKVQYEGKYNMITDASKAASEANLPMDVYYAIVWNYMALCDLYITL